MGRLRDLLRAGAVVVAAAQTATAQTYEGQWNNTTFGSSGDGSVVIDANDQEVTFVFDVDGFVFGAIDPDGLTLTGPRNPDNSVDFDPINNHPVFGNVTGMYDGKSMFTFDATGIMLLGNGSASIDGTVDGDSICSKYSVKFGGGGGAVGTFDLTLVDEGTPGDLNGDTTVNGQDLLILLNAWGPCDDCPEDLDGNGAVSGGDLLILLNNWG